MSMMNKIFATVGVLSAVTAAPAMAAMDYDRVRFYGGFDANYNHFSHEEGYKNTLASLGKKSKNSTPGMNLFLGVRFNENFGLEAGHEFMKGKHYDIPSTSLGNGITASGSIKTSYSNTYIDAIGYIPLDDYLELTASLGLGVHEAKAKSDVQRNNGISTVRMKIADNSYHAGVRVGGGLQYNICDNLAARARLVYQKVGGGTVIKSGTSLGLGLLYMV